MEETDGEWSEARIKRREGRRATKQKLTQR